MDNKIRLNRDRLNKIQNNISKGGIDFDKWKLKWHFLMICYGWIPLDDFLEMDIEIIDDLIVINKEAREALERGKK